MADSTISNLTAGTVAATDDIAFVQSGTTKTDDVNGVLNLVPVCFAIAFGDETTAHTTGTAKVTWNMPFGMVLTDVKVSLVTAGTGGTLFTVDLNEAGTSVLSTKITVDATEKTSATATTPPVISDSAIAEDALMTVDIDTMDTGGVAAGGKLYMIGTRTAL